MLGKRRGIKEPLTSLRIQSDRALTSRLVRQTTLLYWGRVSNAVGNCPDIMRLQGGINVFFSIWCSPKASENLRSYRLDEGDFSELLHYTYLWLMV